MKIIDIIKEKSLEKSDTGWKVFTIILGIIFIIGLIALSWLAVCGIVKLITMCFGLQFSWGVATGIWLIGILLRWIISAARKNG